jgi:hypothetical protein
MTGIMPKSLEFVGRIASRRSAGGHQAIVAGYGLATGFRPLSGAPRLLLVAMLEEVDADLVAVDPASSQRR